jgi:hypothetical protein
MDSFLENKTKISNKIKLKNECLVMGVYAHIKGHATAHQ